jgi:hypothetical protein
MDFLNRWLMIRNNLGRFHSVPPVYIRMIRASRTIAGISRTVRTSTVSRIAPPTNIQATSPADLHCTVEPVNRRATESVCLEQKGFLISLLPVALRVCREMKMWTAKEECSVPYHSS